MLLKITGEYVTGRDCCYMYSITPGNLTCNPQEQPQTVALQCDILAPDTSGVRVKWWYSSENRIGSAGVLINTIVPDFNISGTKNCSSPFNDLFTATASMLIPNFTSTYNGYYWCQMVVNSTSLQPSPTRWISFSNTSEVNCTCSTDFFTAGKNLANSLTCAKDLTEQLACNNSTTTCAGGDGQDAVWYGIVGLLAFLVAVFGGALTLVASNKLSHRDAVPLESIGKNLGGIFGAGKGLGHIIVKYIIMQNKKCVLMRSCLHYEVVFSSYFSEVK